MKNFPQPHVEVEGKGYGGGAFSPSNSSGQKNTNPQLDNHQHLGSCTTSQQILYNNLFTLHPMS